jgi:hypothetical protein
MKKILPPLFCQAPVSEVYLPPVIEMKSPVK